ncbi:MAG: hypothetical protein ACR2NN_03985 [Bryobacteraceae bacterium]
MSYILCCGSHRVHSPERLAVLPFENLTSDARIEWLGTASAAALVSDLTGLRQIYPFRTESVRSAYLGRASEVLEANFEFVGDRLRVHASLENLARHKMARQFSLDGPAREGILPLVNQLAKDVAPEARTFSTRDPAAFGSFGEGLSSADASTQARLLQTASVQDPKFTASYIHLSEAWLVAGDRADAAKAAAAGAQQAANPVDRARLAYLSAVATGDPGRREQALVRLTQVTPADPDVFRNLGQTHMLERKYGEAVGDYEAATRCDPADPATFNQLGYAQAFALDLNGARQSLATYQKLAPEGDMNPIDSLGEVSFYLGDFPAAERYFLDAQRRDAGSRLNLGLVKAAQARLMTGDRTGANAIFNRYMDAGKNQDGVLNGYQRAQWEWITGLRKQALNRMQHLLPTAHGDNAALLGAQLAIWNLQIGDRDAAARLAQDAAGAAVTPGARNLAALCGFLSAHEFHRSGNHVADAYALLLVGRYGEAIAPLEVLYRETAPESDAQVRTMLAWAYSKAGRTRDAAGLVDIYPIPLTANESLFASLMFPRFLQVRSVVFDLQGRREEAQRLMRLYREYLGDLPDKE